jgi:hypothetical protein
MPFLYPQVQTALAPAMAATAWQVQLQVQAFITLVAVVPLESELITTIILLFTNTMTQLVAWEEEQILATTALLIPAAEPEEIQLQETVVPALLSSATPTSDGTLRST